MKSTKEVRKLKCSQCYKIKKYPPYTRNGTIVLVCEACQAKSKVLTKEDRKMLRAFAKTISVDTLSKLGDKARVED